MFANHRLSKKENFCSFVAIFREDTIKSATFARVHIHSHYFSLWVSSAT